MSLARRPGNRNFLKTEYKLMYNKIKSGAYNNAAILWFDTNKLPYNVNVVTLEGKVTNRHGYKSWTSFQNAIRKREERLKKYTNQKMASKFLKFENAIKKRGVQYNNKNKLFELRKLQLNTNKLLRELKRSVGSATYESIIKRNQNQPKTKTNQAQYGSQRTRPTRSTYASTLF